MSQDSQAARGGDNAGGSKEWLDRYSHALMNTFGTPQQVLVRGRGAHVWDADGKEYIDLLGGIAVNALGHAHPAILKAVTEQLGTLGHTSNFFTTQPQIMLAERLLGLLGRDGRVFVTNSGTEANEAALKLTRRTGRTHLVAAQGSFHGRTMGALALTSKAIYREPFEPLPGEVTFVPFGDSEALAAAVTDRTAAVILEPIQGEGGVIPAPDGYLESARRITRDAGALLWLDEIQTGIGRTGAWFAHTRHGAVEPDLVTLAKGLGGGIPVGACVALGEAGHLLGPGNHGTTFGGNAVACAAALAVLDTIEREDLLTQVVERGQQLRDALLAEEEVTDVEGEGLLLGVQLNADLGPHLLLACREAGFLVNSTGPRRLRLAPPLVLTEDDVRTFGDAWAGILQRAHELHDLAQKEQPA